MSFSQMLIALILVMPISNAIAQDKIIELSPRSRAGLDLYEQPGAAQPIRKVPVDQVGLPLDIQDAKTGFYKIAIAEQVYWVRGAQIRISRASTAGCGTSTHAPTIPTIATPGAGKDACK